MATPPSYQPSFSPRQKWTIALNVTLSTIAALAVLLKRFLGMRFPENGSGEFGSFNVSPATPEKSPSRFGRI